MDGFHLVTLMFRTVQFFYKHHCFILSDADAPQLYLVTDLGIQLFADAQQMYLPTARNIQLYKKHM